MNKKLFLSSLVLLSLVVTGCSNKKKSSEDPVPESFETSLTTVSRIPLFLEQESDILVQPEFKATNGYRFVSLNPEIASVDENGHLKGLAEGVAKVAVIDKNDKTKGSFVEVDVVSKMKSRDMNKVCRHFEDVSKTQVIDNVFEDNVYLRYVTKDDETTERGIMYRSTVCSKAAAYFGMTSHDFDSVVQDGSYRYNEYQYIFYTNEGFDTYSFKTSNGKNGYYVCPTAKYMSKGRLEPTLMILDNFLVAGRKIFEQQLTGMDLSSIADTLTGSYTNVKDQMLGQIDENTYAATFTVTFNDDTADLDDESNYGIPYGTPTPTEQKMTYIIQNDVVVNQYLDVVERYEIGGSKYEQIIRSQSNTGMFTAENSRLIYPDKTQYTLADTLFDI